MVDAAAMAQSFVVPIMKYITYAGLLIGVVIGFYFLFKYRNYRYKCFIYTKRAEGQSSLSIDKGGYFKLTGDTWLFKLLKSRHAKIIPPDNKFIWKTGKKDVIHLRNLGENQYIPFNPIFNTKQEEEYLMDVNYDENLSWYLSMVDFIRNRFDWKEFWEKYGTYVVILSLIMFTIIVIYLNFQWISAEMGRGEAISGAIDRFIQNFGNSPSAASAP